MGNETKAMTTDVESNALFCDLCVMVVADIECLLTNLETFGKNLLVDVCGFVPEELAELCANIINTVLSIVIALVDALVDPEGICSLITLCLTETERYMLDQSRSAALKERMSYIRNQVGENYLCGACEDTVEFVHDVVVNNQTWEAARFFMPLCELYPSTQYRANCQTFLERPGDVSEFANKYLDPVTDCQISNFCPKQKPTASKVEENCKGVRGLDHLDVMREHISGGIEDQKKCEVCRSFSSAVEGVAQYNENVITDGLKVAFEDICETLPEKLKPECTNKVTDVLPGVIYQMARKFINPDYLCTEMNRFCQ